MFQLDVPGNEKPKSEKGMWFAIVAFVFVIAAVAVVLGITSEKPYLTYSNYSKIENGMTYSQVVEILDGHQGVLDTTSSFGGYTLSYYTWSDDDDYKCIVVGFENGKVCAKSQLGLD